MAIWTSDYFGDPCMLDVEETDAEHYNLYWLVNTLDCGSSSCVFARSDAAGMRVNGRCSCFNTISEKKRHFIIKMFNTLKRQLTPEIETVTTEQIPSTREPM